MNGAGQGTAEHVDALVDALVESNDQIVALYDLMTIGFTSLDKSASLDRILIRGSALLNANLEVWTTTTEPGEDPIFGSRPDLRVADPSVADETIPAAAPPTTRTVDLVGADNRFHCRLRASRSGQPFSTGDGKLLTAVANVALAAGFIARIHETEVASAVVRRDYTTASELATLALPTWRREIPGLDLFARSRPARMAGGDFYQFALHDDQFWFVVGDVSGKGLPSALIMTAAISASTAAFQSGHHHAGSVLATIDGLIYDYLDAADRFVTATVGCIDTTSGLLRMTNAGHSPVVVVHSDGAESAAPDCPPMGVFPLGRGDDELPEVTRQLRAGDRLIIGSDGYTEQLDPAGQMYGMERFIDSILQSCGTAREQYDYVTDALEGHGADAAQSDDQTLVVMAFGGSL